MMLPGFFGDMIKTIVNVQTEIMSLEMLNCTPTLGETCFNKDQNRPTCGASICILKWRARILLNSIRSLTFAPIKATVAVMYKTYCSQTYC